MKKVFLDFGANRGQGLRNLKDSESFSLIVSYEPNPVLYNSLLQGFNDSNVVFVNAAVWKHTGTVNFSVQKNDEASSVECLFNGWGPHDNIIETPCVDILDIIEQYSDYEITIKMDIEGSEFTVIRRLLENIYACKKIKKMYVEWHTRQPDCTVAGETRESELDLKAKLLEANPLLELIDWA